MTLHDDELAIDNAVVRALVDDQFPRFAGSALYRPAAAGSTNVLFRLGDELLLRFPRQPGGSTAIDTEAAYLPVLAPFVPVQVPVVLEVGEPGPGYPERWSVLRWIDGEHPAVPVPDGPGADALARDLAGVLSGLHAAPVPPTALLDPALRWYRARPLRGIDAEIRRSLELCRTMTDLPLDIDAGVRFWDDAMGLPDPSGDAAPRWVHGDLLAENVLLRDGRLAAVLDFGALALGDPCVDLMVGWELFGPAARDDFAAAVDVDALSWARGRAWAFAVAVMTFPYYWRTMPGRCNHRLVMARAVLDDHAANG